MDPGMIRGWSVTCDGRTLSRPCPAEWTVPAELRMDPLDVFTVGHYWWRVEKLSYPGQTLVKELGMAWEFVPDAGGVQLCPRHRMAGPMVDMLEGLLYGPGGLRDVVNAARQRLGLRLEGLRHDAA